MPRSAAILLLVLSACTSRLIVDDGSALGGTDSEGSAETDVTAATVFPTAGGDTGGTDGPFSTSSTSGGTADPSGASDTDAPPPEGCWTVEPMFEAPGDAPTFISDQDFDGRDELWMLFNMDQGPGPGDTTLYAFGAAGEFLGDTLFNGFVRGLGDIDGDGLRDAIAIAFSGGGPSYGYAPAEGLGSFAVPPLPLNLELSQGTSGFFDATQDGFADVFRQSDTELELASGDGMGGFTALGAVPLAYTGRAEVSPVRGDPGFAVWRSVAGFGGGGGDCQPTQYNLLSTHSMGLVLEASSDPMQSPNLGSLRDAHFAPEFGGVILIVDTCTPGSDLHDFRQLLWMPGFPMMTEETMILDKAWTAAADFDGDGILDLAYVEPGDDRMSVEWGIDAITFSPPELVDVPADDIRGNNVRRIDMDGDGRDELVRGVVTADGDPPQLVYDRVYLGDCAPQE